MAFFSDEVVIDCNLTNLRRRQNSRHFDIDVFSEGTILYDVTQGPLNIMSALVQIIT